jgi:hypothetical protein
MNNEPVAWMNPETLECGHGGNVDWEDTGCIPLYTQPHPDNLGLAESIIKQQQIEIESLKDEVAKWKMSYENSIRFEDGYGHN